MQAADGGDHFKRLGEYGIPQVWYYPLTKSYWFGFDADRIRQRTEETANRKRTDGDLTGSSLTVEKVEHRDRSELSAGDDEQGELGIEISNLSKYYGNKMALKNLSVKFYRNMITAFLGRNGAGKSTTWSIITGLVPPSHGTVYVDGYDILSDIKIIRKRLGFAPQYNILFDLLTVKEHLVFFSR